MLIRGLDQKMDAGEAVGAFGWEPRTETVWEAVDELGLVDGGGESEMEETRSADPGPNRSSRREGKASVRIRRPLTTTGKL